VANYTLLRQVLVVGSLLITLFTLAVPTPASAGSQTGPSGSLNPTTRFYVPKPEHDAVKQIAALTSQGRKDDAALIREMINTPTAVWVESGSPKQAEQQVRQVTHQAAGKKTVPVLVLYNIPFRDCAQYSAGGAASVEEYMAWIDGVAAGIGDRAAVIILEPDGLGIIPWYTNIDGQLEWCQPREADAATAAAERFEMLNYAVDALKAQPNTSVYLDGTHNAWLNVGDITDRLLKAGVEDADGFFLNASNYQWTENLVAYGTWVSSCIAYVTEVNPGDFGSCGNQYWSGGPANNWTGVALDPAKIWNDTAADPTANTAGITSRYDLVLGDVEPTTHFVIDTSRNGQGPWTPTPEQATAFPDPQTWCNPPNRGLGTRPTADTDNPLVDAYLWIKVPGESDGQCSRGLGTGDNVVDPIWGQVDPDAGVWFPEQALELAKLANPPLK
jgi:endoglucanase